MKGRQFSYAASINAQSMGVELGVMLNPKTLRISKSCSSCLASSFLCSLNDSLDDRVLESVGRGGMSRFKWQIDMQCIMRGFEDKVGILDHCKTCVVSDSDDREVREK